MKKMFLLLLCAATMSNFAFAQDKKISNDQVPGAVSSAFKAKFPTVADAKWEMEGTNYEACFKQNGSEVSANFDKDGNWLETETEIKVSELPPAVQTTIHKEFADYKVKEASKVQSAKNGSCYEAEISKDKETLDVMINSDGKLLSKTTEMDADEDKD